MQKLQCELCGSIDIVRTDDGFFMCRHCGCKYTLEQAKAMLGTVETTIGTAELNRLLKNAQTQADIGRLSEAESTYTEVTKQFPDDYRGWLGLLKVNCKIYLDGNRIYLPGHKFNSSPLESEAAQLFEWYGICQKLAPAEETEKIKAEWESFWDSVAEKCKAGEFTYEGGSDIDFYKGTSAAMYEYAESGFENAKILNSLGAFYNMGKGCWEPRQPHIAAPYKFWLCRCCQTENQDCKIVLALPSLPPLCKDEISKIKAQLDKAVSEAVAFGFCPYCGSELKDTPLGPECEYCKKSF